MRKRNDRYECAFCGAVLDIPRGEEPRVVVHAASGEPNVRVVNRGGEEIHRCAIRDRDHAPMKAVVHATSHARPSRYLDLSSFDVAGIEQHEQDVIDAAIAYVAHCYDGARYDELKRATREYQGLVKPDAVLREVVADPAIWSAKPHLREVLDDWERRRS